METCRDGLLDKQNSASEPQWRKTRFNLLIKKTREFRAKQNLTPTPVGRVNDPARWTRHLPLADYHHIKWLPTVVNVVSLCDLLPIHETKMPLDLYHIAKTCDGTFYAPAKFAAVQLGIDAPKSRILIFHTGRIVQTGTNSVMAAHNAISLTLKILRDRAGLYLRASNFSIINLAIGDAPLVPQ